MKFEIVRKWCEINDTDMVGRPDVKIVFPFLKMIEEPAEIGEGAVIPEILSPDLQLDIDDRFAVEQICVSTFPNAMGLENAGDNLYQTTASSGDPALVDIKASGTGSITSGILEMSNVDLSQEFTNMITTQRGFQANSRIITTSDTLLEELINLKR